MRSAAIAALTTACIPRLSSAGPPPGEWTPPDNGWALQTPPTDLAGEGYDAGQVAPDFRLPDQFGDDVSLSQFYGDVVLLDISEQACRPCQELARHTEETWRAYRDEGFTYLTVLQRGTDGPADNAVVNEWVDAFGITAPVLGDVEVITEDALRNNSFPALLVIDRDMVIRERVNGSYDEVVRAAIEDAL